jgi:hypothetical protein
MGVADHPPCNTVTFEPVSALMLRTLSVELEREVAPRVGIAVLVGLGSTENVAIGDQVHNYSTGSSIDTLEDVRFERVHFGMQASYYSNRFAGAHVSAELVYVRYGWADPDFESIDVVSGSAYGGYKWVWRPGLTVVLQAGLGFVETNADPMTGWRLDRDGTLGPLHLAANASVGWSF